MLRQNHYAKHSYLVRFNDNFFFFFFFFFFWMVEQDVSFCYLWAKIEKRMTFISFEVGEVGIFLRSRNFMDENFYSSLEFSQESWAQNFSLKNFGPRIFPLKNFGPRTFFSQEFWAQNFFLLRILGPEYFSL